MCNSYSNQFATNIDIDIEGYNDPDIDGFNEDCKDMLNDLLNT